jgi:hypothetical protein
LTRAGTLRGVRPGITLGHVNFAGNLGWLAVSPTLGGLAAAISPPVALSLLTAAALVIAALASVTGRDKPTDDRRETGSR